MILPEDANRYQRQILYFISFTSQPQMSPNMTKPSTTWTSSLHFHFHEENPIPQHFPFTHSHKLRSLDLDEHVI
jgi:hypothetical protein